MAYKSEFPLSKKELEYQKNAEKYTADPRKIQKKIERPRYGFQLNKGWTVKPDDLPCETCGNPAATVDQKGRRRHPGCRVV